MVRTYRRNDKSLVSTFKGRQKVLAYSQAIDLLLSEEDAAAPVDPKGEFGTNF